MKGKKHYSENKNYLSTLETELIILFQLEHRNFYLSLSVQENIWGQPVPTDFISETSEISEQIQVYAHSFEEAGLCWKFSNCNRVPNAGGQTGHSCSSSLNLVASEHRTLRLYICHRTACLL